MKNDMSLESRMKRYESSSKLFLTRRVPVIIRLDGKAFHTFTRGLDKPFDEVLAKSMQETMKYLCENIQGCVFGYTQSDEITLVLTDYDTIYTDAWFKYNIQKIVSISASMATMKFNEVFNNRYSEAVQSGKYTNRKKDKLALFDSRAFNLPKDEVANCLIWRQQDATRNSIEAAGQAQFGHSRLQNINCNEIQNMLFTERGINWNDYPTMFKRGSACYKSDIILERRGDSGELEKFTRKKWVIDTNIPIFTQDRDFIEKWI